MILSIIFFKFPYIKFFLHKHVNRQNEKCKYIFYKFHLLEEYYIAYNLC